MQTRKKHLRTSKPGRVLHMLLAAAMLAGCAAQAELGPETWYRDRKAQLPAKAGSTSVTASAVPTLRQWIFPAQTAGSLRRFSPQARNRQRRSAGPYPGLCNGRSRA